MPIDERLVNWQPIEPEEQKKKPRIDERLVRWEPIRADPSTMDVILNAANKGLAGVPDALLNAPNRLLNLGKAAIGTAATAAGRPDWAPEITPDPDYAARALRHLGAIRAGAEPTTSGARFLDAAVQGAVGGLVSPANGLRMAASNAALGALSGAGADLVGNATGSDALAASAGLLVPAAAANARALAQRVSPDPAVNKLLKRAIADEQPLDGIRARLQDAQELVPGSLPMSQQVAQSPAIAQLARSTRNVVPGGGQLTLRDQAQNQARLDALDGISPVTGTAAQAADNAGGAIHGQGRAGYDAARQATRRAYEGRDPFKEARLGLPVGEVEATLAKYFGKGAGAPPAELASLVDDIRTLGTVREDPAVAQRYQELAQGPQRPSGQRGIDVDRDPLDVAIRKLGGVNIGSGAGELRWLRESDLGKPSVVHGPLARRTGGNNWDILSQRAHEYGYIDAPDPQLLMDRLAESARGNPVMSMHASDDALARFNSRYYGDMPDELLKPQQSPGVVDLDTLTNLRSRASEAAYKLGQSGDKRAATVATAIRDHLDAQLEATAGRAAMRKVLEQGADAPGAMYRKGLGEVDFRFGSSGQVNKAGADLKGGSGIDYLVTGRNLDGENGRAVAMSMPGVLAHGAVGAPYQGGAKVNVTLPDGSAAVLRRDFDGKPSNHWVLTGWNHPAGMLGDAGEVTPARAYTSSSPVIGQPTGASASILGLPGEYFQPDMARAHREATRARIDQADRFETGFARRLWRDGADGLPQLTGGEIPRAAFNNGATQAQEIAQWNKMGRPGEDALKNYAITDLVETAAPNGLLNAHSAGKWTRGRSEAIKGLLSADEQSALRSVVQDARRAADAEALGRAGGSNTAQNLEGGLLFSRPLDWASNVPKLGALVRLGLKPLRDMQKERLAAQMQGLLLDPQAMARALGPRAYDPFSLPAPTLGGLLGIRAALEQEAVD